MNPNDGLILLNKPRGLSSNQALCQVKKRLRIRKAGHTGSLDPLASGMLPLCFGEATKFARFFLEADKAYTVVAQFCATSTTGDAEGEITQHDTKAPTEPEAVAAIQQLRGEISQIPPMFSAVKVQGKALYKLARRGIEIERPARQVHIREFECQSFDESARQGTFTVVCSKGTYIRTLIEDCGKLLGCGAYVVALHRDWVAPFHELSMSLLDEISHNHMIPIPVALAHLPEVSLCAERSVSLGRGMVVKNHDIELNGSVMLNNHEGHFIGVGEALGGEIAPKRLMRFANAQ